MKRNGLFLIIAGVMLAVFMGACSDSGGGDKRSTSSSSDGDADGDSDSDSDGDADTDGDGDADTDGDGDADTDGDGDADTDSDGDADTDGDGDADTDGDGDTDTDADGDKECEGGEERDPIFGCTSNARAFMHNPKTGKSHVTSCVPEESREQGEPCAFKQFCKGYKEAGAKIYCDSMVSAPIHEGQGKCTKHDQTYNWQGTVEKLRWYKTKADEPRDENGFINFTKEDTLAGGGRVAKAKVRYLKGTMDAILPIGNLSAITAATSDENGEFVKFAPVQTDPNGLIAEVTKPGGEFFNTTIGVTHAPYVGGVDIKNIPIISMEIKDNMNKLLEEEGSLGAFLPFGNKGGVIGNAMSANNREPLAGIHLKPSKPRLRVRYLNTYRDGVNEQWTSDTGTYVALNGTVTPIITNAFVGGDKGPPEYSSYKERRVSCPEGKLVGKSGTIYVWSYGVEIPEECKDWEDFVKGDCHQHCQKSCPTNEHWPAWW